MKAMLLKQQGKPLEVASIKTPECGENDVLIRILACAVCRTDLHICDGELTEPKLPLVPGHEIIGEVLETGTKVEKFQPGDRVGVPWLGFTCGACSFCQSGHENLCDKARFTGYHIDGGYAEFTVANQHFVFPVSNRYSPVKTAPMLCAGLIGYRSYCMTGDARRIGIYGFGAAAHIITQIAVHDGREIFAFTRTGDLKAQGFADELGAVWSGSSDESPPELLDAAIIYAPVGELVVHALRSVRKGGVVVCAGIHMSNIPAFPYKILWGERCIRSVANLTRRDGEEFFKLIERIPVQTVTEEFTLSDANIALDRLRYGEINGAAVLVMN